MNQLTRIINNNKKTCNNKALFGYMYWGLVVPEKTLESPWDSKEIKPVDPKGNQRQKFIGRTVAKTEAPILWPPDLKSQFTGKDSDAVKD